MLFRSDFNLTEISATEKVSYTVVMSHSESNVTGGCSVVTVDAVRADHRIERLKTFGGKEHGRTKASNVIWEV